MNSWIIYFSQKIGIYDYLKLFKDKYFKNPIEIQDEKRRFKFYSQFVKEGDLCFDIGANFGNRTEIFQKLGAKVVALEPQRYLARFIRKKFKNSIIFENKAAGAAHGELEMLISRYHALSSLSSEWVSKVKKSRFNFVKWDKTQIVQVTTLDELINKYGKPDFCKIDVEGFEFQVLQGLSQPLNTLSFEFTIPECVDEGIKCLKYLDSLGKIKCNYSSGESLKLFYDTWLSTEEFITEFKFLTDKGVIDGDIYVRFF